MKQCQLCGKGSVIRGGRRLLRGHYNPTGTSRKYPNIQKTKIDGITRSVCAACIRTMHKIATQ